MFWSILYVSFGLQRRSWTQSFSINSFNGCCSENFFIIEIICIECPGTFPLKKVFILFICRSQDHEQCKTSLSSWNQDNPSNISEAIIFTVGIESIVRIPLTIYPGHPVISGIYRPHWTPFKNPVLIWHIPVVIIVIFPVISQMLTSMS